METQTFAQQPESRLLGPDAAASYLGLTPRSLYRLVDRGVIAPVKIPGMRRTFFDRSDLDALIEMGKLQRAARPNEPVMQLGVDDDGQKARNRHQDARV